MIRKWTVTRMRHDIDGCATVVINGCLDDVIEYANITSGNILGMCNEVVDKYIGCDEIFFKYADGLKIYGNANVVTIDKTPKMRRFAALYENKDNRLRCEKEMFVVEIKGEDITTTAWNQAKAKKEEDEILMDVRLISD